MSENTTVDPANAEAPISPEVADYLDNHQQDNPAPEQAQPDKTESAPVEEAADGANPDKPEDTTPDATDGAASNSAATTPPADPPKETWEVAGKVYDNIKDASAAVRKIAGDNQRMAGDLKRLQNVDAAKDEAERIASEAIEANKAWAEYYEAKSRGENPAAPEAAKAATVAEVVKQVLTMNEQERTNAELNKQYTEELDALPNEPDYERVFPKMSEIAVTLGKDIRKISPKQLYKMARGVVTSDAPAAPAPAAEAADTVDKPVTKAIKDAERKTVAKVQAKKVVGGNDRRSSAPTEADISPELADYLRINT